MIMASKFFANTLFLVEKQNTCTKIFVFALFLPKNQYTYTLPAYAHMGRQGFEKCIKISNFASK